MDETDHRKDHEQRERIAVLETQMEAMLSQHKDMARDIRIILNTLAEAKGGWRMMMLVGGAGGAIGAFLGKWISVMSTVMPK